MMHPTRTQPRKPAVLALAAVIAAVALLGGPAAAPRRQDRTRRGEKGVMRQ